MIHLDTDTAIAHLNGDRRVTGKLENALPNVAISTIVLSELLFGAAKSTRKTQNYAKIDALLRIVQLVAFDAAAAESLAMLKMDLRRKGRPTGGLDALIAATAIANDAELVTHNTKHFVNISGLRLQDWLA